MVKSVSSKYAGRTHFLFDEMLITNFRPKGIHYMMYKNDLKIILMFEGKDREIVITISDRLLLEIIRARAFGSFNGINLDAWGILKKEFSKLFVHSEVKNAEVPVVQKNKRSRKKEK